MRTKIFPLVSSDSTCSTASITFASKFLAKLWIASKYSCHLLQTIFAHDNTRIKSLLIKEAGYQANRGSAPEINYGRTRSPDLLAEYHRRLQNREALGNW